MLPDNDLEAERGSHVEDIDCSLVVRPTRTALDLTLFGEVMLPYTLYSILYTLYCSTLNYE